MQEEKVEFPGSRRKNVFIDGIPPRMVSGALFAFGFPDSTLKSSLSLLLNGPQFANYLIALIERYLFLFCGFANTLSHFGKLGN